MTNMTNIKATPANRRVLRDHAREALKDYSPVMTWLVPTCAGRIGDSLQHTMDYLNHAYRAYCGEVLDENDPNFYDGDIDEDRLFEYGLSFDYVEGGTDYNNGNGYFRWQLSWGGPSDEFRFYADADLSCHYVEYAFLDWFDGATRELTGQDKTLLLDIYDIFKETGTCQAELDKAIND